MSFSSLQQRTVEQITDIPVPGRGGGGGRGGLQGLRLEQNSTALFVEQNVEIPVPGGGLHDLPDPGGSSSSAVSRDERGERVFRTFLQVEKKSEVSRQSESEGARQVELVDSGGLCGGAGRGRV